VTPTLFSNTQLAHYPISVTKNRLFWGCLWQMRKRISVLVWRGALWNGHRRIAVYTIDPPAW